MWIQPCNIAGSQGFSKAWWSNPVASLKTTSCCRAVLRKLHQMTPTQFPAGAKSFNLEPEKFSLGSGMCLEWSLQLAFSSTCQSKLTNRKAPQFQSKGLEIFQWRPFFFQKPIKHWGIMNLHGVNFPQEKRVLSILPHKKSWSAFHVDPNLTL